LIQLSGPLALRELLAGNERFVEGRSRHPDQTHFDRESLATSQAPSVVVVGCSDSRVPPPVIFDQGLGFIFEVRTAGHLLDDVAIASVEYAVTALGTQLVLVLGHTDCGAVTFALEDQDAPGYLEEVRTRLASVVEAVREEQEDVVAKAVEANVLMTVEDLRAMEPIISPLEDEGRVDVVGAVYDLGTGVVTVLD
jgi:carbonic anhydrase